MFVELISLLESLRLAEGDSRVTPPVTVQRVDGTASSAAPAPAALPLLPLLSKDMRADATHQGPLEPYDEGLEALMSYEGGRNQIIAALPTSAEGRWGGVYLQTHGKAAPFVEASGRPDARGKADLGATAASAVPSPGKAVTLHQNVIAQRQQHDDRSGSRGAAAPAEGGEAAAAGLSCIMSGIVLGPSGESCDDCSPPR